MLYLYIFSRYPSIYFCITKAGLYRPASFFYLFSFFLTSFSAFFSAFLFSLSSAFFLMLSVTSGVNSFLFARITTNNGYRANNPIDHKALENPVLPKLVAICVIIAISRNSTISVATIYNTLMLTDFSLANLVTTCITKLTTMYNANIFVFQNVS